MGAFLRWWHKWVGVLSVLALTSFALTGIYLNHRDYFDQKWFSTKQGTEDKPSVPARSGTKLHTASTLNQLPVTPEEALGIARAQLGYRELTRIELKSEKGGLVYKVKPSNPSASEIVIDATTGQVLEKKPGKHPVAGFLGRLHHFNFADGRTRILADMFAGALVVLNISGVWMFVRHELALRRSRRLARERAQRIGYQPSAQPVQGD